MAYEQYKNDASTALASAINNSSDPVTFNVTAGSVFPSTGNFRLRIGDEILLATSRSSNSITAARAQEGTTIAAHNSGDPVYGVLTAESHAQTINDRFVGGTATNYAAAVGRAYQCTDAPFLIVDQQYPVFNPYMSKRTWDPTGYTWHNQGSAAVAKLNDFISVVTCPGTSGDNSRGFTTTYSGAKTIEAWFYMVGSNDSYTQFGICLRNGSDNKQIDVAGLWRNFSGANLTNIQQHYWTDNTTINSTPAGFTITPQFPLGLRIVDNGSTSITGYFSQDGVNWIQLGTQTYGATFTPTKAGIFINTNTSGNSKLWVWNFGIY
jgi:hypothetical protein